MGMAGRRGTDTGSASSRRPHRNQPSRAARQHLWQSLAPHWRGASHRPSAAAGAAASSPRRGPPGPARRWGAAAHRPGRLGAAALLPPPAAPSRPRRRGPPRSAASRPAGVPRRRRGAGCRGQRAGRGRSTARAWGPRSPGGLAAAAGRRRTRAAGGCAAAAAGGRAAARRGGTGRAGRACAQGGGRGRSLAADGEASSGAAPSRAAKSPGRGARAPPPRAWCRSGSAPAGARPPPPARSARTRRRGGRCTRCRRARWCSSPAATRARQWRSRCGPGSCRRGRPGAPTGRRRPAWRSRGTA
mmetsp:Transcript_39447/g.99988  ORF Transcript_39447/g.99988 Transcript_39447/m.99988 type:complete len:301 (+) Transcript_39447:255-1157(+)